MMTDDQWLHERYVATEHRPPRVIVADDEPDVLKLVTVALRGYGFDIVQAHNGAEVLDQISFELDVSDARARPDILIADVRMPGLTGLELLAAVRQARWPTAVVLMTAYPDRATRAEARRLGVNAFFAKPFDVDDLVTAVVNLTPPPLESRGE